MLDKVKTAFLMLKNAVQAGKIYTETHPKYKEFIDLLFQSIEEILQSKKEFIIGVIDGEMAWENEIFFDLGEKLHGLTSFLEGSRIQRIVFQQGMDADELGRFIAFLTRTKRLDQIDEKEYFSLHGIRNIRAGRIKTVVRSERTAQAVQALVRRYESSVATVSQSLNIVLNEEDVDYLDLRFNLLGIMEHFIGRHQDLLNLVEVKKADIATFVHLLNVSILSMFVASKLQFSRDDVLDIGVAALYHDIGKLSIGRKILRKHGQLEEEEMIQIREHPYVGAKILYDYREQLGILPLIVAFEHHVRYDLSGYPKIAYPRKLHIASSIVTLADVYDALAQRRSYKQDYPPNRIYEVMIKEKGKLFDPQLLDRFFEFLGVWPLGSIVELSNGNVGFVVEVNESQIFRPKVRVVFPQAMVGLVDVAKVENLSVTRALNPKNEGAEYLDLLRSGALEPEESETDAGLAGQGSPS